MCKEMLMEQHYYSSLSSLLHAVLPYRAAKQKVKIGPAGKILVVGVWL